ncbi:type IV toxin-antitoxin system AbiEi family antitoxin domain-containing protein [Oribacterium sp. FC2011]|uniref:type IV toxin-antitoxin system AbiEi family antitoxin domain-containing protein n=1 Tax=Oribacterium sp. FC2011 TaxID=1408311 RepID=UPI0012DDE6E9|nr:hypothetical protein [Oribacterium sp. FC2011]
MYRVYLSKSRNKNIFFRGLLKMILSYEEAIKEYGSDYKLKKAIDSGVVFKIENGIYSSRKYNNELEVLLKKYPKAILAGEYAFYIHGLTDVIPEKYSLATSSKAARITDKRVEQLYVRQDLLPLGVQEIEKNGAVIRVYDKERMLIELLRNKNSMPYDIYKDILLNYRGIIGDLEIWRIQEYAEKFPKSKMISKALDEEVM